MSSLTDPCLNVLQSTVPMSMGGLLTIKPSYHLRLDCEAKPDISVLLRKSM